MADTGVASALEREHREIDAGLAEFQDGLETGESKEAALRAASSALRRHIFIEEELLFPPLRSAGLYGPVTVMLMEHAEIWRTLDELDALVDSGGDRRAMEQALATLSRLLNEHNEKEEHILYPQADLATAADVRQNVLDQVASGSLPAGWVCQHLRPGRG